MNKKLLFSILTIVLIIIAAVLILLKDDLKDFFQSNETHPNNTETPTDDSSNTDPYAPYKKTYNFKLENLNRYISYHEQNPNLSYEDVTTFVNIGLDKEFYSEIKEADTSKGVLVLTNKYLKLKENYEPDDLEEISQEYFINGNTKVRKMRKEAKEQFEKLSKDSIANGTPVYGQSAYRPYSAQASLYEQAVEDMGVAKADNDTARPGHSEHQTGLTIDVSSTKAGNMLSFGETESFKWMQENAHKYGFILRYPENYENIHGFMYESWHYRYVGVEVATDMYNNYKGMTYDEYYYKFIDTKENLKKT